MSEPITLSTIRFSAMNLLAMREHSVKEMTEKLSRKFCAPDLVNQAIESLTEQNLQSDARFAEAFIAMRQRQGKGSVLVKMELRERGVASELISNLINESDFTWVELARDVLAKRFHNPTKDVREQARQKRFLHSRGFTAHHIQAAFSLFCRDG